METQLDEREIAMLLSRCLRLARSFNYNEPMDDVKLRILLAIKEDIRDTLSKCVNCEIEES